MKSFFFEGFYFEKNGETNTLGENGRSREVSFFLERRVMWVFSK